MIIKEISRFQVKNQKDQKFLNEVCKKYNFSITKTQECMGYPIYYIERFKEIEKSYWCITTNGKNIYGNSEEEVLNKLQHYVNLVFGNKYKTLSDYKKRVGYITYVSEDNEHWCLPEDFSSRRIAIGEIS